MQHKRVLIIDDEEHIREIASLSFELVEWEVAQAGTGREGVAAALASPPDVILLDVMMPELDGPATLLLLEGEERTRSIPVVFLTAKVQATDKRRYLELGVAGVISKPFDPLTLPAHVEEILNAWRAI